MRKVAAALMVLMALYLPSYGTIYYIDAATGSDSDSGLTTALAWATISKANTTLVAGDTVYIRAGTYTDTITPSNSGSLGSYITYIRYPGEAPILDKSGSGNGITLNGISYICVDGLTIQDVDHWANLTNQANYNIIKNCTLTDADDWGGINLGSGNADASGCDHNQILDNYIESGIGDLIEIFPGSYNVISGNTVVGGALNTAPDGHSCLCIRGNTLIWSEYNEVRDNDISDGADDCAGILLETRYNTFERNIFRDAKSAIGSCFKFCGGTGNIFRYNLCYGSGVGFIIYTNLWDGRNVPALSNEVYNNVIAFNTGGGTGDYVGGISLTAYEGADVIQYNKIKNNIIIGNAPRQIQIIAAEAEQSNILDNEIDHNIIYGTEAGQVTVKRWSSTYTTAQADAALSEFSANIDSDPVFVNAGGSYNLATDYRIPSDSAAEDAGVDVGLSSDYWENSVPSGSAPDIGIHELQDEADAYYLSTTGNNGNPGTIAEPWLTLAYAATQLRAGDTLYIRGGTYTGEGVFTTFAYDGTEAERIVIDNYESESVIFDGEDTYPSESVYHFLISVPGDYVTIRDITIHDSKGSGLNMSGDYGYAYNITGIDSREAGLLLSGTGCIADGCSWTNCGNGYGVDGQTTWGSGIGATGTDCIIRNCTSHTNIGEGINVGGAAVDCIIEDCISYNNDSMNIYLDSATGTTVRRNLVYDTTATPSSGIAIGAEVSQPSGLTIVNNLVMGCFVNLNVDSNLTQFVDNTIAHNVFVNAEGNDEGYNMGVYLRTIATYSGSIFKDNIVIEESASRVPVTLIDASHAGFVFDYNCYNKAVDAEETGAHDVVADPKLAQTGPTTAGNLTGLYFAVLPDSPCIDAGVSVGVTDDYFGAVRPQGSEYDIGASESAGVRSSIKVGGYMRLGPGARVRFK